MLNVELFTFSDKNNFGKFEFLKDVSHGLTGSRKPPQLRPLPQPTSIHRYPLYITFGNENDVSIHSNKINSKSLEVFFVSENRIKM